MKIYKMMNKNKLNGLQASIVRNNSQLSNGFQNNNSFQNPTNNNSGAQMMVPYSNPLYPKASSTSIQSPIVFKNTSNGSNQMGHNSNLNNDSQSCLTLTNNTGSGMMFRHPTQSAPTLGGYHNGNNMKNSFCGHAACQPTNGNVTSVCKFNSNQINRNDGLNSVVLQQNNNNNTKCIENFGEPNYWQQSSKISCCPFNNQVQNNPYMNMIQGGGGIGGYGSNNSNTQMMQYSQISDTGTSSSYPTMNSTTHNMISYHNNESIINPWMRNFTPPMQNINNYNMMMPMTTQINGCNTLQDSSKRINCNYSHKYHHNTGDTNNEMGPMNQVGNQINEMGTSGGMYSNKYNDTTGTLAGLGMYGTNVMSGYNGRINSSYNVQNGKMGCHTMNDTGLRVLYGNSLPSVPFEPQGN